MSGRPHTEWCPRKHGESGKSTSRRGLVGLRSPGIDPNCAPGSVEAGVQHAAPLPPPHAHTHRGERVSELPGTRHPAPPSRLSPDSAPACVAFDF